MNNSTSGVRGERSDSIAGYPIILSSLGAQVGFQRNKGFKEKA